MPRTPLPLQQRQCLIALGMATRSVLALALGLAGAVAGFEATIPLPRPGGRDTHYDDPSVACLQSGTCAVVFEERQPSESERRVFSTYSADGGKTWSDAVLLSTGLTTEQEAREPSVDCLEAAESRLCVAAWQHVEVRAEGQTRNELRLARSLDGGKTWGAPEGPFNVNSRAVLAARQPRISCFMPSSALDPSDAVELPPAESAVCVVVADAQDDRTVAARFVNGGKQLDAGAVHEVLGGLGTRPNAGVLCGMRGSMCVVFGEAHELVGDDGNTETAIVTASSQDGGISWSAATAVGRSSWHSEEAAKSQLARRAQGASMACMDAQRCILVAEAFFSNPQEASSTGNEHVELALSEDGGATWGAFRVLDAAAVVARQRNPAVSCEKGRSCALTWVQFDNDSLAPWFVLTKDAGTTLGTPALFQVADGLVSREGGAAARRVDVSCATGFGCVAVWAVTALSGLPDAFSLLSSGLGPTGPDTSTAPDPGSLPAGASTLLIGAALGSLGIIVLIAGATVISKRRQRGAEGNVLPWKPDEGESGPPNRRTPRSQPPPQSKLSPDGVLGGADTSGLKSGSFSGLRALRGIADRDVRSMASFRTASTQSSVGFRLLPRSYLGLSMSSQATEASVDV